MSDLQFNHFEAIYNAISSPSVVFNTDFLIVAVNDAMLKSVGTSRAQMIGRPIFEIYPDNPNDPTSEGVRNLRASLNRVIRDKITDKMAVQKYDIPIGNGSFEPRYWSPTNIPILDQNGNVAHILHITEDITRLIMQNNDHEGMTKEFYQRTEEVRSANLLLKESNAELENRVLDETLRLQKTESSAHRIAEELKHQATTYDAMLSSSFDLLFLFDRNLRLVYANPAQLNPWKRSLEEVKGKTFEEISAEMAEVEPEVAQRITENFKRALSGEVVRFSSFYHPGGQKVVMESVTAPVYDLDGNIVGITGATRDITEQVVSQTLLEEERQKLKEAAADLQKAKEEAENANALKSAFLANMSHEIRTPLGAMLGFSSLLKEADLDPGDRDQYIDTIIRNGNALISIIDDILDLAKVEAGKLDVENIEFSLKDLLLDSVELFKDKAAQKGIRLLLDFDSSAPERISTDPSRLRQILVNLIGNAVKFTSEGSVRVVVRCRMQSEALSAISIDVKDTGIGLTEEHRHRLFQPFVQADNSTTRKFGGTGLGLVLSQRLAEALDGKITLAEADAERGCTFTLTFNATIRPVLAVLKPTAESTLPIEISNIAGTKILLVDDSSDNRVLVTTILVKYGCSVESACDGEEAVRKALCGTYDVILMDIQMPTMDGFQAKRELDKHGYEKPIVALTAHAMNEERTKTRAVGFKRHLSKPLDMDELLKTVAELAKAKTHSPDLAP